MRQNFILRTLDLGSARWSVPACVILSPGFLGQVFLGWSAGFGHTGRMAHLPPVERMLSELVAVPSVSSVDARLDQSNRGVVDRLAGWSETLGARVTVEKVTGPLAAGRADMWNLMASWGPDMPGRGLVLSGHTDTVPFDDRPAAQGGWKSDPFAVTPVQDGAALAGLGTADMKGFFGVALDVMSRVSADRLRQPVTLLATADEESSMAGARALMDGGLPLGDWVVVGEPTGLVPIHKHKGIVKDRIVLRGSSGHSSDPRLGRSALEGMREVLNGIDAFRTEIQAKFRDVDFDPPEPTVNLGTIHGGDAPNRICAECELKIDIRLVPGMDSEAMRQDLRGRIAAIAGRLGLEVEFHEIFVEPPFAAKVNSPLVSTAASLSGAEPACVCFGTEAPFFRAMDMDVVIWGPGDIRVAHRVDEFVERATLSRAGELLGGLLHRFCVEEQPVETARQVLGGQP